MSTPVITAIDCTQQPVDAALWLARAFVDGRRLAISAPGCADHAHHVAVEFVHPVIAGTRPLPAVAVDDLAQVRRDDVLLIVGEAGDVRASERGADLWISAAQPDVDIVRTYHLLWELVHVALEHPGLVGSDAAAGGDSTGFLYPFLDAAETDETALREALAASAEAKIADSTELVAQTLAANAETLLAAQQLVAEAAAVGATVHVMGNGGSATDSARMARLLQAQEATAVALAADYAVVTALANDVGVERVFSRQLEALARPGDVLVGCSTSGASANLAAAFSAARAAGVATVGLSGYGGAAFDADPSVQHSLSVRSESVHRIQEAQAALIAELCGAVASGLRGRNGHSAAEKSS